MVGYPTRVNPEPQRLVLVRHGQTDWAHEGRHTGWRDIPLNAAGEAQARTVANALAGWRFSAVLCSPLQRARRTAELAGLAPQAEYDADLREWNYGDYEGRTFTEIQAERPGWNIWNDGVVNGESISDIGARADRVITRVRDVDGDVCLVAHGHLLRILTARWLGLAPIEGRCFEFYTCAISVLGSERSHTAVQRWNDTSHLPG